MKTLLTNLTNKIIESLWDKVKQHYLDASAEYNIDIGVAFEDYIKRTGEKYSKIKTLLNRHTPENIYKYYVDVGLKYNNGKDKIDTTDINNLTNITNKILIIGNGGIGKSTLLKHLFLSTINCSDRIPVMIELRGMNSISDEISVEDIIYESLTNNGFLLKRKYFEYSMSQGAYNIFFDGYDELNKSISKKVYMDIRKISEKYYKNNYIISSRHQVGYVVWNDFTEFKMCALDKQKAVELIGKLDIEAVMKENFIYALKESYFEKYKTFASIPLLLIIMLLTFERSNPLPERINDFYGEAFVTLFNKHDAFKDYYTREHYTKLDIADFREIFAYFCFKSYFKSEYEFFETKLDEYIESSQKKFNNYRFTIEDYKIDLIQSVCMMNKEGLRYYFTHRSFQEYFAAWYTCRLKDDIQINLLRAYLSEISVEYKNPYFLMLYNFQKDKVEELIILPVLKEIKKELDKNGFSIEFLKLFFKEICFSSYETLEDIKFEGYTINNLLYNNIKRLCSTLYGYKKNEKLNNMGNDIIKSSSIERMLYNFSNKWYEYEISIDDASEFLKENDFYAFAPVFKDQIIFLLNVEEQLSDKYSEKSYKNNLASIISRI